MSILKFIVTATIVVGLFVCLFLILKKGKSFKQKGFCLSILSIIVAFIPNLINLIDYWPTKAIEIISVTPVFVYKDFEGLKNINPLPKEIGCYLVVNVKNGHKDNYISNFEINGKLKLRYEDYYPAQIIFSGKKPEDVKKQYQKEIPFYQISWSTWPDKSVFPIKIEANSQQNIVLTLWDLILNGQREHGMFAPLEDYVGYIKGNVKPKRLNRCPSVNDFCELSNGHVNSLNKNIFDSDMSFEITINGKTIKKSMNLIKESMEVDYDDWNTKPLEKILLRYDKEILKP